MKPRRILFILIMAGTVLISYFYSRQVYTFYLDIYYHVYKGYSEKDMIRQGYQLYKDRDGDALQDHARKLQLLYPDSPEASLLSGMALLQKGDYESVCEAMKVFYSYPVFEIKSTRALPNIMREKKSVKAMVEEGGLKAWNYKSVEKQFDKIIKKIFSK